MDNEKMIESIRALCKNNNISTTKLEEILGFSQGLISRWKDKIPSVDKIIDIADYFQISLDEVVGRNQEINDEFLQYLCESTVNKTISWNKATSETQNVKTYPDPYFNIDDYEIYSPSDYTEFLNNNKSIMYFVSFDKGYICIYARYQKFKITQPDDIILFIQADDESELIPQEFQMNELIPLWVEILSSLNINAPDEIRAAQLRQQFIGKAKSNRSINDRVESLLKLDGCLLYDIETDKVIIRDSQTGYSSKAEEFYENHKNILGEVKQAQMIKGFTLVFISETRIMKFSGLSCGSHTGMAGYNAFLRVMEKAGFDISNETIFKDNFTLDR